MRAKDVAGGKTRRGVYSSVIFYERVVYKILTNREPTRLSKYIGAVLNSISCCVLNNAVTNRTHRTRISRAARGRFAPGDNARCVSIAPFVFT